MSDAQEGEDVVHPADVGWASFGGEDVCPQCQTPEERRDAAQRIVASIRREIDRRRREGLATDPYEAALIAYAMQLAEAGDEAKLEDVAPAEAVTTPGDRSEVRTFEVAFTSAFFTGHPLAVRLDNYEQLQEELGAALTGHDWRVADLASRASTFAWGGGFSHELPLIIARRECVQLLDEHLRSIRGSADPLADGHFPLRHLQAQRLAVDIYDLGVAVMTADFVVAADSSGTLSDTGTALKAVASLGPEGGEPSPLAKALESIAGDTAITYGKAVAASGAEWLPATPPLPRRDRESTNERLPDDQGRLLWLHPVTVYRLREAAEARTTAARELALAFEETIDLEDGTFAAGIGSSAIVVAPGSEAAERPQRLTLLHWAYYAYYMGMDRELMAVLDQQRWSERAQLRHLEHDAERVFAYYLRILNARARLDSNLTALGGDELQIWDTISKVQKFGALEKAVERKVEGLEKVAQMRLDQATAYRERRIGDILGVLSVLTVVTVTGALIGVLAGARPSVFPDFLPRLFLLLGALAIAIAVYWYAFFRTTRLRRRDRRRKVRSLP